MSMPRTGWLRPRWLFSWRAVRTLLWMVVLALAAVAANIAGIHFFGSIVTWERWLADAAGYFLVWRLCLYASPAWGWRWMRRQLLVREGSAEARWRLIRTEIAGVAALVALEVSLLAQVP